MSENLQESHSAEQPPGSKWKNFWEHSSFVKGLLFLLLTAFALAAIVIPCEIVRVQPGLPSPHTLYAAFPFAWEDTGATEKLREAEEKKLPVYYLLSAEKSSRILALVQLLKEILEKDNGGAFYSPEENPDPARKELQEAVSALPENLRREFQRAASYFPGAARKILRNGIIPLSWKNESKFGQLVSVRDLSNRVTAPFPLREIPTVEEAFSGILREGCMAASRSSNTEELPLAHCAALAQIMAGYAPEGNLVPDTVAMKKSREVAREKVMPVIRSVPEGEMLLERKKIVTPYQAECYQAYRKELQKRELKAGSIAFNIIRSMLVLAVTLLCLRSIHPLLMDNNRTLGLLTVLVCAGISLNKLAVLFFGILAKMDPSVPPEMLYYSLPVGMAVALISAFLGTRSALFSGFFLAIIASMHVPEPARMLISGFLISACTAVAVKGSANYREFFVRSFLGSYLASFVIALLFLLHEPRLMGMIRLGILERSRDLLPIVWIILLPFFTGLLTALAGQVLLYVSELLFDATTSMSMQLYSDRNNPLLMKLQMEAPGTYYHCLAVAQLAEKAASAIGADRITAHVMGLYHDVGKLKQPLYFTENSPGINRHEGLEPSLSAVIILNHVKYGLEVARKYKLKKPIREAIAQHHGDSMVVYFYEQARVEAVRKNMSVDPKLFSYEGKRPTSREISILMLADCCDAASRSAQDLTEEGIRCLVSNIIDSKTRSGGQLENSLLSVKELSIVRESLIETLTSQKHGRIAYPKVKKEKEDEDDLFMAAGKDKVPPSETKKI